MHIWSPQNLSTGIKRTEIQNYNHVSEQTQLLHRTSYKTELKHLHALVCHLLIWGKYTHTLRSVKMILKECCEVLRNNSDRITKISKYKGRKLLSCLLLRKFELISDPFRKILLSYKIDINYMISH